MLQQTLTYYVSGSAITLSNDDVVIQTYNNVTYQITSSFVMGPGSDYTAYTRIEIISGSTLLATFPYDQTNLIINSASSAFTTSSNNIGIQYTTTATSIFPNSSYFFKIINSSSLYDLTNIGIIPGNNTLFTPANSSSKYIAELYSGDNKYNQIYLYDATSSLLFTSSYITGSGSIVLDLTGSSFYYINAIVSGAVCCPPTFTDLTYDGYYSLIFSWETGSCGNQSDIVIQSSTDNTTWITEETIPYTYSPYSAYITVPTSSTFYRLKSSCSDCASYAIHGTILSSATFYYVSCSGASVTQSVGDIGAIICVNTTYPNYLVNMSPGVGYSVFMGACGPNIYYSDPSNILSFTP